MGSEMCIRDSLPHRLLINAAFTRTLLMTFRTLQRARGLSGIPHFMKMTIQSRAFISMKFGVTDNSRARCTVRNVIKSVLVKAAFIMSRCGILTPGLSQSCLWSSLWSDKGSIIHKATAVLCWQNEVCDVTSVRFLNLSFSLGRRSKPGR